MQYPVRNEFGEIVGTIDYDAEERARLEWEEEDHYEQMEDYDDE